MRQLLIDAINSKAVVTFTYDGIERVAEPHAIGSTRAGSECCRLFQTAGGHVTPGHDWDLCQVGKMRNLRMTGASFAAPRPGYKRGDSHLARIYAQL